MKYQCEVVEKPALPVLSIRTRTAVGNLPQVMGKAYGEIYQYLGELGEYPADVPFAAYYNMDMQDLDVEIGFPVSKPLPGKGEIKPGEIPAGRQASCMHLGPYREIEPAYTALMQWIAEKGYTPTGVAYEFYLNDPAITAEKDLRTRIGFLLK